MLQSDKAGEPKILEEAYMFSKGTVVASAMAAALAFMSTTASAKTNFDVNVNIGAGHGWCYYHPRACGYDDGPGYGFGYGYGYYPRHFYYPPRYQNFRISCGEAKQIVRNRGFYKVRTQSCGRHVDTFVGWKSGKRWLIEVGTQRGNVRVVRW